MSNRSLTGALGRVSIHEVVAGPGHRAIGVGFGLALGLRTIASAGGHAAREALWVREEAGCFETGLPYGPGLVDLGLDPRHLLILRLRTAMDVLRAGLEAARCAALGAIVIETREGIDLTDSRRLKLAIERSGSTLVFVRGAGPIVPNAAQARWLVRAAAATPSLESGMERRRPCFDLTLLKHHAGIAPMRWHMEWCRERRDFVEALSQPVVPVSVLREVAA